MSFTGGEIQTAPIATVELALESVLSPDGSINEGVLRADFGLGLEEAQQEVSFGGRTGTVAAMLADPVCPIGNVLRDAYRSGGLDSVTEKFDGLAALDPGFKVVVTPDTFERERLKKKMTV